MIATFAATTVLMLTASALAPRYPTARPGDSVQRSRFPYAPGYGWYGGQLSDVVINGQDILHSGDGPVVLDAPRLPATMTLRTTLRGRDTASYTRAMIFVHAGEDTLPNVALSQRGDHLELHIERRGSDWGLTMPYVRLPNVFRDHAASDTQPLYVRGIASTGQLALEQVGGAAPDRVALELTPTIGWAMLQSVIGATHPLAPAIRTAWLLALCAPIGWWSGRSRSPIGSALGATALLSAALLGAAWWHALPVAAVVDWVTMGSALALTTGWSLRARANGNGNAS
jgi:hypothetical protein